MLILTAVNVTGEDKLEREDGTSDYEVSIYINKDVIWQGNVNNHIREMGASELLHVIAEHMESEEEEVEHKVPFLVAS